MAPSPKVSLWVGDMKMRAEVVSVAHRSNGTQAISGTFIIEISKSRLRQDAKAGHNGEAFMGLFFVSIPPHFEVASTALTPHADEPVSSFVYRSKLVVVAGALLANSKVTAVVVFRPKHSAKEAKSPSSASTTTTLTDGAPSRKVTRGAAAFRSFGHRFILEHKRLPTASELSRGLTMSSAAVELLLLETGSPCCSDDIQRGALPRLVLPPERSLSDNAERNLRERFGIGQKVDHVLEEVCQDFEVTRERIRPVSANAVRELRHPSRAKRLKKFIEE